MAIDAVAVAHAVKLGSMRELLLNDGYVLIDLGLPASRPSLGLDDMRISRSDLQRGKPFPSGAVDL